MRNIFSLLAGLLFLGNAFCSSADSTVKKKLYYVSYPKTATIIAVGAIADYFANNYLDKKPAITDEELLFLNTKAQKDLINPIDRWTLGQSTSHRAVYQQISGYGMATIVLLPFLLTLNKDIRKDWLDLLLIYAEGHTIAFSYYNFSFSGPMFQNRYRPLTYYPEISNHVRESGISRNSLYSGHVASAAYSTFFMTKVYCDYHPEIGSAKYLLYIVAAIPPMLEGYARIKALEHFPSDVAVGFGLGAILGILIPELHKVRYNKGLSIGMFTSPDGMGLNVCWKLPKTQLLSSNK